MIILICRLLLLAVVAMPTLLYAEEPAMLRVYPVGVQTCVATSLKVLPGQALASLSWYANDTQAVFPMVVLLEGQEGSPPDIEDAALVLAEVTGQSLSWNSLTLDVPVVSTTGVIDVVFRYPENLEISALGTGGGPGVGLVPATDSPSPYLSFDGYSWSGFVAGHRLAVDPVFVAAKQGTVTLESLRGSVPADLFRRPVEDNVPVVERTALHGAHPNPFNPRTTVRFDLQRSGLVRLRIYDVRGRLVQVLADEWMDPGRYELVWEGDDRRGSQVASGVYFLTMEATGERFRQKMALIR